MSSRRTQRPGSFALVVLLALAGAPTSAADDEVDYARDIRPLFAEHCTLCHGPDDAGRQADLQLDDPTSLAGVVEPGSPDASALYLRVSAGNARLRMPPARHGEALAPEQIDLLRRWIEQGASWAPHWAYAPFRDVAPPTRPEAHPIDRFVNARLEEEGLRPSPPADRATLIRRLSLDLLGMVPTPEETSAFESDTRDDAVERLVDRLLASPHYAERWARHWLDLARYADSNGFTIDGRRSMWPYRDWVIRAIADDQPFDQFTVEQLAGDLLPSPSNAQLVATGFHRNTQINQEGGAKDEENRINAVLDRANTTGSVWLGTTLGCAQCHTHKYDPISHVDYYRMVAFFDQTADGGVSTGPFVEVTNEETAPLLERFQTERARLEEELAAAEQEAGQGWIAWRPEVALASEGPELRLLADASIRSVAHNPQTSVYDLEGPAPQTDIAALRIEALPHLELRELGPGRARSGGFVVSSTRLLARPAGTDEPFEEVRLAPMGPWEVLAPGGQPHVTVLPLAEPLRERELDLHLEIVQEHGTRHVLGRFRVSFASDLGTASSGAPTDRWRRAWRTFVDHEATRPDLPTSLILQPQMPPRTTHLLRRGDFRDPGQIVQPGVPRALDAVTSEAARPGTEPKTRLDLARWLTHRDNALVHRVTVNRWWQRFFGLGIVETENDFGTRGALPSHPDLLEWLAAQLPARGFSMKQIHRLIVTSDTYQRSSAMRGDLLARDPRNRLLARQTRPRLDAEALRDSALRASGLLSAKVGGPPVQPPQPDGVFRFTQTNKRWDADEGADRYRRTLYTRLWRSSPYPFLTTFDAPQPNVTCTRRVPSSTPLQALTLANDPMVLELAGGLGRRLQRQDVSDEKRIDTAWRLTLGRSPRAEEMSIALDYLERQREQGGEEQAWAAVARVLFNLDEFSHRN